MPQALYRRWRPQVWDEVVGQDHVIQTLRNAVRGDRVAHAYLFAGPRGTGKTTTARLLAKAVNCLADDPATRPCNQCQHCLAVNEGRFMDLIEIDAASNTSVDDVRDLRDRINFSPNEGRFKVYIIDEVHMLSTAAFNALLKTLEEPPQHAIFVLATTEVHKIPATVLSRCQRHEFRRLPLAIIRSFLQTQTEAAGFDVEPEALDLISRQATGSLRDAISLLDQLTSASDVVDLAKAQAVMGTATDEAVLGVVDAIVTADPGAGLSLINDAIDSGADPRQLARQIVDYLRSLLLIKMGNDELVEALESVRAKMKEQESALGDDQLVRAIDTFNQAALEGRATWQPKLPLELAMVEAAARRAADPSDQQVASPATDTPTASKPEAGRPNPASVQPAIAKPPEGPAATEPLPDPDAELTFQDVLDRWDSILAAAYQRDPRCQALLNSGRPLGMKSGRLVVGFASDLLREKMEKDDNTVVAAAALEQALGRPVGLRCVLSSAWDNRKDPGERPPVENGGMVETALRDLGAEVKEVHPAAEGMENEDDAS
ncbi:MAG: DNA polymerase III subunit gamma/tau [Anaerolineales bacterium]